MGNTIDNGMKTFLGGKHALAGVFYHELETRVFVFGETARKQLQPTVSAIRDQQKDWIQMAATIPGERSHRTD
jgi:hypothetical protein